MRNKVVILLIETMTACRYDDLNHLQSQVVFLMVFVMSTHTHIHTHIYNRIEKGSQTNNTPLKVLVFYSNGIKGLIILMCLNI